MAHDWLGDLFRRWGWASNRGPGRRTFRPRMEPLDQRLTPSGGGTGELGPLMADGRSRFQPPAGTVLLTTEVNAVVGSADPVGLLTAAAAGPDGFGGLDLANTLRVLPTDGGELLKVALAPGTDPKVAVRWLESVPGVVWADPNYAIAGDARDFVPNDTLKDQQYSIDLIGLTQAWDVTLGKSSVIVGVTDDGVGINHPDLNGNIWTNPGEIAGDGIDNDNNGYVDDVNGWNFAAAGVGNNNVQPTGSNSHGTHVSGTIAARTNNNLGVVGNAGGDGTANSGVRIMPIRWDDGTNLGFTATHIAQAFAYGANNGAKIINSSYNFDGFVDVNGVIDPVIVAGFQYSYGKGVLHFLSAGNNGQLDAIRGVLTYPLFVAATDQADQKASFSNYGRFVDISAPGVHILSTIVDNNATVFSYDFYDGTSMSTPNAAGVAALIWSAHPTWTREQVAAQLLGTADSITAANPGLGTALGTGRVNAGKGVGATIGAPKFTASTLPTEGAKVATALSTFTLDAPFRFDPATVVPANFELREAGPDGGFDTADDLTVPIVRDANQPYRVGVNQFTFAVPVLGTGSYRFTAKSGGLKDPFGQNLDGDGKGGDFVRSFKVSLTGSVTGAVFEDVEASNQPGVGSAGVPGARLFLDKNGNGAFDTGEPTTLSDFGGRYRFSGLVAGSQTKVGLVVPTGWAPSTTSAANPRGAAVVSNTVRSSTDFGLLRQNSAYVRVFEDLNKDAAFQVGEPGVPGFQVLLDANKNGKYDAPTATTATTVGSTSKSSIGDLGVLTAPLDVIGVAGPVVGVTVTLNITHTSVSDLALTLIAPDGTRVPLFYEIGFGANFTNTTFDDTASVPITSPFVRAPYTGTFRPQGRLSTLVGKVANGRWLLEVSDGFAGDSGTLDSFSLTFTTAAGDQLLTPAADGTLRVDAPAGASNVQLLRKQGFRLTTLDSYVVGVTTGAAGTPPVRYGLVKDATAPRLVTFLSAGPDITNQTAVNYSVTFSEPIEGLKATDFTLASSGFGGTKAAVTALAPGAKVGQYILTVVTPGGYGDVSVSLSGIGLTDFALNPLTGVPGTSSVVTVDTIKPTSTLAIPPGTPVYSPANWPGQVSGTAADAETGVDQVRVTVRQDGTGFYYDGTSFASPTPVDLTARVTSGTNTWTLPLSAGVLPEGKYSVTSAALDFAGNRQTATNSASFGIDSGPPQVVITPAGGAVNGSPVVFTLTFSEPVNSTTSLLAALQAAGTVVGGTFESLVGGPTVFLVSVRPTGAGVPNTSGVVTLNLPAGAVSDQFGQPNAAAAAGVLFDAALPTVALTTPVDGLAFTSAAWGGLLAGTADDTATDPLGSGVVAVAVAVRRQVAGVDKYWDGTGFNSDAPVYAPAGGAAWSYAFDRANFPADDVYQFLVRATDRAGNQSIRAVGVTIDNAAPVPAVVTPGGGALRNAAGFASKGLTGTAVDTPAGPALTEVSVRRTTDGAYFNGTVFVASAGPLFVAAGGTAGAWSLPSLTADRLTSDGQYLVTVRTTDRAGNVGTATSSFTFDNTAPRPVDSSPANGGGFNAAGWPNALSGTIADSGDTAGVRVAILRQADGTYFNGSFFGTTDPAGKFLAVDVRNLTATAAGTRWTFPFSAFSFPADGQYTLTVEATDKAGSAGTAESLFSYDNTAPTSTVSALGAGAAFSPGTFPGAVIGTAKDSLSGVGLVQVSVRQVASGKYFDGAGFNSGNEVRLPAALAQSGAAATGWTLPLAGSAFPADGQYLVSAYAVDGAGNSQAFGTPYAFGFDATPPTAVISTGSGAVTNVAPLTFAVTFSTAVGDLDPAGLAVVNGSVLDVTRRTDNAFVVRVTPASDGAVSLSVLPTAARDAAGNPTLPAGPAVGQFDRTAPTVTLSAPGGVAPLGQPVNVAVTFSEPVVGFGAAALRTTNASILGITGGGARYQVQLLPAGPGVVGLSVVGGAVSDPAGNQTAASLGLTRSSEDPRYAVSVGSVVRSYDAANGLRGQATPFGEAYTGTIRVASADFNGDGIPDVVAGTGPGGASSVVVLDGKTFQPLFQLSPFEESFAGGVFVAVGDLTGDGVADLVITPDEGGGPRVRVFDGKTFAQVVDFFGIADSNFRGGARAAVGDVSGDGVGDLIVAAGFGGGPRVAVFNGTTISKGADNLQRVVGDFFAYEDTLRNGVYVAAGDLDGDGIAELVVGGGPGGGPRVTALSGAALAAGRLTPLVDLFAGDPNSRDGVRVAVKRLAADQPAELIVGGGSTSRLTVYTAAGLRQSPASPSFDQELLPGDTNGVFVG